MTTSFYYTGAQAPKRAPLRQFAPLLVATVGLPGRGKSLMAKRLSRYLNYTGDVCQGKLVLQRFLLQNCADLHFARFTQTGTNLTVS
jgi:pantothenate kinase-related protein Tda10